MDGAVTAGRIRGPARILGVDLPDGVDVDVLEPLDAAFSDSCFYPPDTALAAVRVSGCPVAYLVAAPGERHAVLGPDTAGARTLSSPADFREAFRDGDEDLRDAATAGLLEWSCPSWVTLFEDLSVADPTREWHETCHPTGLVAADVVTALRAAVSEARSWLGWSDLFAPGCPPERWVEAVLTGRPGMAAALLGLPGCPAEARVAGVLARG